MERGGPEQTLSFLVARGLGLLRWDPVLGTRFPVTCLAGCLGGTHMARFVTSAAKTNLFMLQYTLDRSSVLKLL